MGNDGDTPETAREGPEGTGRDPELLFGGGVLVGAMLLGLVWAFVSLLGGSDEAAEDAGGAQVGAPLIGATTAPAEPTRLQRCSEAAVALGPPLAAAGPAMDQWAVHIGAMNKLVVGAITLKQATAFWDRTRVGAHRHVSDFRNAMRRLRSHGVDCPSPGLLIRKAPATLRACVRQVDADLGTLAAAHTAIDTWAVHVRDMDRLRAGKLSPADASRMWLSMWQRGQAQLDAYRDAARVSRRSGGCTRPAVTGRPQATASPSMDMEGMH